MRRREKICRNLLLGDNGKCGVRQFHRRISSHDAVVFPIPGEYSGFKQFLLVFLAIGCMLILSEATLKEVPDGNDDGPRE
jgi:hypothetical protein